MTMGPPRPMRTLMVSWGLMRGWVRVDFCAACCAHTGTAATRAVAIITRKSPRRFIVIPPAMGSRDGIRTVSPARMKKGAISTSLGREEASPTPTTYFHEYGNRAYRAAFELSRAHGL